MFYINMAEIRLNFEERKMVLKWYVKFENVVERCIDAGGHHFEHLL